VATEELEQLPLPARASEASANGSSDYVRFITALDLLEAVVTKKPERLP
jgi:hypothetical protein